MKDLLDAINTRVKEPYWGFFLLSFLAFNWRGLFLLFFASGTAQEKIFLFDSATTFLSLIIFPVVAAFLILLITPWLKVLFGVISRIAYEKLNSQELVREHKYLAQRNVLENERAKALANKENELIDQAKRDVDIDKISDESARNKLKIEIDKLRQERNNLIDSNEVSQIKSMADLTENEFNLVNELSKSKDPYVQKKRLNGQHVLLFNGEQFNENDNSPKYYRVMDAITSLARKGLLKDLNNEGKLFELTPEAKKMSSKLNI